MNEKMLYVSVILALVLFTGCKDSSPFDTRYALRPDGQLGLELFNKEFGGKEFLEKNKGSKLKAYGGDVSSDEIKMIFDISMGLQPGFLTFDDNIVKPIRDAFRIHKFYKCGHTYENVVEEYTGGLDYFRNIDTYRSHGCLKSHIKGGLSECVREKDKISIFFTDFLYDERGGQFQAAADNNAARTITINNDLENGWGADMLAEWFKSGGKLYVFYDHFLNKTWPGSDSTKYFALLFVPNGFKINSKLNKIIDENNHILFDPFGIHLDFSGVEQTALSIKNGLVYSNEPEIGLLAMGLPLTELQKSEQPDLGKYQVVNTSNMWADVKITCKSENINKQVLDHTKSSNLFFKPKDQQVNIFQISTDDQAVGMKPDLIQSQTYINPDLFPWHHRFMLSDISNAMDINPGPFMKVLESKVRTDGRSESFTNRSLYLSLTKAIDQSKEDIFTSLSSRGLFDLYTYVWVGRKSS